MDFRRSTLVLIISFLFLDIFLFGTFWQMKKEVKSPLNNGTNENGRHNGDRCEYDGRISSYYSN